MNIDNFEKRAKSLFDGYKPSADNEQIWQNIEPHLKKKKKRRGFIIFFWGAGIALLLGLLYWGQSKTGVPTQTAQQQQPARELPNADAGQIQPAANSASNTGAKDASSAAPANQTPDKLVTQQHAPTSAARAHDATQKSASTVVAPKGVSTNASQSASSKLQPSYNQSVATDTKASATTADKSPEPLASNAPIKAGSETNVIVPTTERPTQAAQAAVLPATTASDEKAETVQKAPVVEKNDQKDAVAKKSEKSHKKPVRRPSKKRKSNLQHAFAIQGGVNYPVKILAANPKSDDVLPQLLKNRRKSETVLDGYAAGANYALITKSGLLFKGGINYLRQNERFKVSFTDVKEEIKLGVVDMTVDGAGAVIAQTYGYKKITTTTQFSNVSFNNFQYLNVPIGLGIRQANKKSKWELSGGLDFNLLFQFHGTLFNLDGDAVEFTGVNYRNTFKKTLGMGCWASYGYSRKLTKNIDWQVSANTQMQFQPVTQPGYPFVQRYINFGLQAGLVYNLKKGKTNKHKK